MKILIAAGGSGGHIFPAIALARMLRKREPAIGLLFVGSNKSLDRRIFEKEGLKFSLLSANKLSYGLSPRLAVFIAKLVYDTIRSFFLVITYRPDAVAGFGGYVSFPVMLVSCVLGIPRLVHEQNVVPGRANRVLFRLADRIAVSFEDTMKAAGIDVKKAFLTGNPIRSDMFGCSRSEGAKKFGLDPDKFTMLVIGGSQGAHFLNKTFVRAISDIDAEKRSRLQVIHLTGVMDYEWAVRAYEELKIECGVFSFIDRIEEAYAASDLVITRAGASAVFETAFFGKPMILVPYPFAMSHQSENARFFSDRGAAIKVDEKDLSPALLKEMLVGLVGNGQRMRIMGDSAKRLSMPNASDMMASAILELAR